jgi:hypothetical protein
MIVSHISMVTLFVVLLFAVPVLIIVIKQNIFTPFSLLRLTKTFNKAFLIQVLIGLIIALVAAVMDKVYYSNDSGNTFAEIFIGTTYTYIVIGTFMYLPCLGLLNLISWLTRKIKPSN